jgi:hypothetical protein
VVDPTSTAELLLLLGAANGAPILARNAFGKRFGWPLDAGIRFLDGRPLLGPSKTWRGVAAAGFAAATTGALFGLPVGIGGAFGLCSMAGDVLSSFIKRRLGVASSDSVLLLDQIPEAALPLLAFRARWSLGGREVLAITALFLVLGIVASELLFRLKIRKRRR